ncbi:hypothetical protein Tco_1054661 [Tanacetum coccineum]|uniref:Reverse transcriptase n=1 Tax=Tanacetum coccineum TaxID=301880 RepID=A0ABQ5GXV1_9ASTR
MFHFESMWLRDKSIQNVVRDGWACGLAASMQHDPCGIVSECANRLSDWNKRSFGHVQRSIKSKQKTLQILQSRFDGSTCDEQRVLREQIKELLTRKELMWKQRSRVQWLREGDMNTRFFHSRASNRCYFSEIFSSSSPQDCESAVNDIDRSLTDNERQALERRVTSSEAYEALMQMDSSKAPGPDGMTALFYQKIWCFTGTKGDGEKNYELGLSIYSPRFLDKKKCLVDLLFSSNKPMQISISAMTILPVLTQERCHEHYSTPL